MSANASGVASDPTGQPTGDATPAGGDATPAAGAAPAGEGAAEGGKPDAGILGSVDEGPGEPAPTDKSKDGKSEGVEFEIKLSDGVVLPDGLKEEFAEFTEMAKGIEGMTPEMASKVAEWQLGRHDAALSTWEARGETWAGELKSDTDFGGEKLPQTVMNAKRALRQYGGEAAASAFAELGIGNHPELVRMLARVGAAMGEDNSGVGGAGNAPAVDKQTQQLQSMYPSMYDENGNPKPSGA